MAKAKQPGNYSVGYKRPPANHQFKPGQSGNPTGKKVGRRNIAAILHDLLLQRRKIEIDGRLQWVSLQEAVVRKLVGSALKGDLKAFKLIDELLASHIEPEPVIKQTLDVRKMTQQEAADTYMRIVRGAGTNNR